MARKQGDRRGLNPRQLEPQSTYNRILAAFSRYLLRQAAPVNAVTRKPYRTDVRESEEDIFAPLRRWRCP